MADSALGSALSIPESALKKIKEADERLEKIQRTAEQTASSVKSSFGAMKDTTNGFIGALDQIISKLGIINSEAGRVSSSFSNIGAKKVTSEIGQLGSAVSQAATNIDRMAATQRQASNSMDFSKSVTEWQNLQALITATTSRQQELTQAMRKFELEQQRIQSGKGGVVWKQDKDAYAANSKEYEANQQILASLREKQQAIIANNQALAQQAKTLQELKNYHIDSGSLDNQRSKNTLAQMREYYKEEEKSSAKQAKNAEKKAEREQKAAQKEADAVEKAEQKKRDAWAKSTAAYGQQYHNERQAMYNQLFSAKNSTPQTSLAYSNSAQTLRDHVIAIKELQQARLNLITTDKDYKKNLSDINEAIKRHSKVLKEAGVNTHSLGEQTSYLAGYISRLAQRTAVVFSMNAAKNFVEQIAEVRGQFELSERSLEAILQSKPKADEIFNKTVELAVKSPFRIKDLVDYTRQLSAYRIESDKLYDTTKRLADVSAGLGVDMGRLILAYGQVKAAAYLRGSEVRQFTEAGINMYGELQSYFKEVKGEAYTTAQIVDMISKRKVTFEDVEAIFKRMTDKGGTFYNMQEIQAETLQGKISNLKDAFDVMLNDIGKSNQGAFNGMISIGTSLLNNWKAVANVGEALISILVTLKARSMFLNTSLGMAFTNADAKGIVRYKALFANAFNSMGKAVKSFGAIAKTSLVGLGIFAAIEAISTVISKISEYNKKVQEAKEESIKAQGAIGAIAGTYKNLASSASDANNKLTGDSLEKNIEDRRAQLQKLIDLASKDGLNFKINVETIKEEDLDKTFDNIEKKYKTFTDDINEIEQQYAKNDNWNTWFTDGLDDDAEDYKEVVVDFLSKSSQMEQVVAMIDANYDKATSATKKYFDEVREGQKEGESNLEYWQRMQVAISNITTKAPGALTWLSSVGGTIVDMNNDLAKIGRKADELNSEFDSVFGDLRKKYNNDPIRIQAVIDKTAAKHDWSQYERDLAYRHFGINVSVNKDTLEKEVNWVDNYLRDYFAKQKFGINLVVKEIDDDKALDSFISRGDQAAKAAKNWQELEKRLSAIGKNTKEIDIDDSIRKLFKPGEISQSQTKISVSRLKAIIAKYKEAARKESLSLGVDPFEKQNAKNRAKAEKQQRDILQERISLLKDMNSKYNELIKTESKETALSKTRKYFNEAAKNVGWSTSDILPDDKSVAKRIKEIGAQYKELSKRGGAFRTSADITLNISKKEYDKMKDDISRNVDDAFSQLQLYKKLSSEGLSEKVIKSMFGDMVTSFDDVKEKIDDEFNKYIIKDYEGKYGTNINKWGEKVINQYNKDLYNTGNVLKERFGDSEIYQQYLDKTQKLNQQVKQDTIEQAQELIKAYKQQLSDQLQLDRWYISERNKLQTNADIANNPELKKQLQENLDLQYRQKTDANTWKDFQNSDMYIRMFDNLEQVSGKALDAMAERLKGLRVNLKDLDPTQLKAIVDQINKVNEVRDSRNPFKALVEGYKEMVNASKKLKDLGGVDRYVELNNKQSTLKDSLGTSNRLVESLEKQYEEEVKINGEGSDMAKFLSFQLSFNKKIRDNLKEQLHLTDEQIRKLGEVMTQEETAKSKFSKAIDNVSSIVSSLQSAFESLSSSLGESSQVISGAFSSLLGALSLAKSIKSGDVAGMISGTTSIITGLASIFSNESKIDNAIKKQERAISRLQNAYEKLKKSMDDAFDTERLYEYNKKSVEALKKEKKAYEAMINAEKGRKHPDKDKIDSWQQQISSLNDTIKELGETMTETLGGFGSQSNYKSAAEAFAESWVDAFNEGSDTLDALNDKFNEYFDNLLAKQITQRASQRFIQPILEAFDKAVSEGSDGGNNGLDVTKDELANLKKLKDENLAAYNDYLKKMMEALGVKATGSSNISSLQQGIQSVTETTAQALESILNSMRYFLATQQADVRAIKDTLIQRLGNATGQAEIGGSNIMVSLMQQQVGYLRQICDNWDSVLKGGHKQGGKGLKVFMNN